MMQKEEIEALPWDDLGHEQLIRLCRNWNDEADLFRRIVARALELVYTDMQELADEIGEDVENIARWIEGEDLPQEQWMLLILTSEIQVRLQAFSARLSTTTFN